VQAGKPGQLASLSKKKKKSMKEEEDLST